MRVLIFQHSTDEAPGTVSDWLQVRNYPFHVYHLYLNQTPPKLEDFDFLIVLGGAMNVDQTEKYPWLKEEKKLIQTWLSTNKPYLGICLGGQLLAQALGARVFKHTTREIGFHEVKRTELSHKALRDWPKELPVFQWHEDHFTLPEGADLLLSSEVAPNQAFAKGNILGLQFHPESTEAWIRLNYMGFSSNGNEPYVQSLQECEQKLVYLKPMTKQFLTLLDNFVGELRVQ